MTWTQWWAGLDPAGALPGLFPHWWDAVGFVGALAAVGLLVAFLAAVRVAVERAPEPTRNRIVAIPLPARTHPPVGAESVTPT